MAQSYDGSCHCGAVKYKVNLEKDQAKHILCHCGACKQMSGGAFTLNQIIPRAALQFTQGEDTMTKYTYKGDSGNGVDCYFCPKCSANPYHHQNVMGADQIVIRTVLLDQGKGFEPAAEIYGKEKMGWEKEVAETFAHLPPQ